MKCHFCWITLAAALALNGLGCNSTPSELEFKEIGKFYVQRIEDFYSTKSRYPSDLNELLSHMDAADPLKINPKGYFVSYELVNSNSKSHFALVIGDILNDGRELHFTSDGKKWFFDS